MSNLKILKQGHSDGFCGPYCLANFIILKDNEDREEAFKYFVEIAERLRILTAWKIIEGYYDYELVEMFNFYSKNWASEYAAFHLKRAARKNGESGLSFVRRVAAVGGGVIISRNSGRHWLLVVYNANNDLEAIDSCPLNPSTSVGKIDDFEHGIVIVPTQRIDEFQKKYA